MALIGATNQQKISIFKEINETSPNKCQENKEIIKKWLSTQSHLPKNYDERILKTFIRGCKHDIERVKRKLDHYFCYRTIMPDIFSNRDPTSEEFKQMKNYFVAFPLPELTPEGCRVTLHKLTSDDPTLLDVRTITKYLIMLGEIRLLEEGPISGDVVLFDVECFKASMASKILNPIVKKGIMCSQNALPQRLKEIHVINAPPYIDTGVNIFKMFVKQKIKDRFHVSSGIDNLYKYVPQDMLPADYGGKEKSIDSLQREWYKKLEAYRSHFEEQENICSDESKRLNKVDNRNTEYEALFGTNGSFHTLSID